MVAVLAVAAFIVFEVIGNWMLFEKAGHHGWESIIPIYSSYVAYKLYWGNGWFFLIPIALVGLTGVAHVGFVFSILLLIFRIFSVRKKARAFGYNGIGFAVLLYFFDTIVSIVMGVSADHPYIGVPQDGSSYEELKAKLH